MFYVRDISVCYVSFNVAELFNWFPHVQFGMPNPYNPYI